MKKLSLFAATAVAVLMFTACDPNNGGNENGRTQYPSTADVIRNAVQDVDGNSYDAVRIGDQVWMATNLKTTHYADGTEIPQGTTISDTTAYRYCPANNPQTVDKYGYLYNWPAVMHGESSSESNPSGMQGICPNGWHVPSDAEWIELKNAVARRVQYGESIAQALASNDSSWAINYEMGVPGLNPNLNNSTGFSAVPAGDYDYGGFDNIGNHANFWSATQHSIYSDDAYCRELYFDFANVYSPCVPKFYGFSVRCLRD